MESFTPDLLEDVGRTEKPRRNGLTMVLDAGLGPNAVSDLLTVAGDHFDRVKIAWGSSLITGGLEEKLALYERGDVLPVLGGTLFEYAWLNGKVEVLLDRVAERGLRVEISDGAIDLPRAEKLRWIERFAAQGEVFSEVGRKIGQRDLDWERCVTEELSAGSAVVVLEGSEIGPAGQPEGEPIRGDIVDAVLAAAAPERLMFETLEREEQLWFLERMGPNVNLANILPDALLTLESFRRGLKERTLLQPWKTAD